MARWTRWGCALLPAALVSPGAQAQSSVTLYGIVDEGVRYMTHADPAGDSKTGLVNGGLSESRWGLKGNEDLGGGWSAFFQFEDRFYVNTGQSDPTLPFFSISYVGLKSSSFGQIIVGRQYNVMIEGITIAGYASVPWIPYNFSFQPEVTMAGGIFTSNQAQYQVRYNDVVFIAGYAFGNEAGNFGYGNQLGAALAYSPANGPVNVGGAYSESKDSLNGASTVQWTLGGSYTWDQTRFAIGYIVNQSDAGFSSFANGPYTAQALAALKYTDFARRQMIMGGITQTFGNAWHFGANVWRTLQTGKTSTQDGSAWQYELVADYGLSKRTDVYVETDYSIYRGDLIGAQLQGVNSVGLAQKGTQLGVMAGLRHQF